MLVDREPERSSVRVATMGRLNSSLLSSSAAISVGVFACFFAAVILLQWASGAYRAEFSGYPDEPAHYITSLMVRDYLASLHWSSPFQFAVQYYHHYPKVAFGHWPPFFYVVQAIWMLLFSTSRISVRLEIAFTTALLAYSVYGECRRWFAGYRAPILAGLLTVCIPLMQVYGDEEMSEALLTLLCFWAAIFFARYLDSGRWQDNLYFGIFFSLAVLTKGNGWLLAGIVPVGLVLTRKISALLRPRFWIAPAVVAVLCLPWQLITLQMAERGWTGGTKPSLQYTLSALGQFGLITLELAGIALGVLALLGIAVTVVAPAFRCVESGPAVMFGLIVSTLLFHAIVPAGVEDRKMVIAIPAWILFLFAGGNWIANKLPFPYRFARWRAYLVALAAAITFGATAFAIPQQRHYGYDQAAHFIASDPDLRRDTILVSDNSVGEGLLISEVAMDEARPGNVIVRGTKALADVDWAGDRYQSLYSKPEEVTQAIHQLHVNLVVVDTFPGTRDLEHNVLLQQALQDTQQFQLIRTFAGQGWNGRGEILIYKVRRTG